MLTRRADRSSAGATLRHPDVLAIAALMVATAVLVWQRFWLWNGLDYLDIPTFYAPWYSFLGEQLRSLNVPGWNPHQFSGTPFAADPQSGWWYFPAMVFFTFLNPIDAYVWMIAFHLALAGISTYLFARMIGCRAVAAFVAAFLYEFGPLVNHISCCLIHVQLAAWIPTALIGVELSVRRRGIGSKLPGWALTAFALSQMFAGWVGQGAYNGGLVVGAYLVVRNLTAHRETVTVWARLTASFVAGCATFALAGGFAAAGLWPRLDLLRESNVADGEYTGDGTVDYALGWSAPEMLDKLLSDAPGYFTTLYYLGASAVALSLLALPTVRRNAHAAFFWSLVIVASVLALERITPLHRLFYLLPRFESLHEHVPMRIVAVQWIGIAVLAGLGLEHLLRRDQRLPLRAAAIWIGLPALAVTGYLALYDRDLGGWSIAAMAALVVLTLLLRQGQTRRFEPLLIALIVAVVIWEPAGRHVVDAVVFGGANPVISLPGGPVSRDTIAQNLSSDDPGGAGAFLQQRLLEEGPFRFFGYDSALQIYSYGMPGTYREWYYDQRALDLLINARAMGLGLFDIQGYNPVQLVAYVEFLTALNSRPQNYHDAQVLTTGLFSPLLDLLSVRYVVVPATVPPGRPDLLHLAQAYPTVFRSESVRVLERAAALPRAWVVRDVRVVSPVDQTALLLAPGFDPTTTAVAAPGLDLASIDPVVSAGDTVAFTMVDPDQARIQVTADAPGVLVINEIYAAGWNAYVNGEQTDMVRANGAFRAVVVPAGLSQVTLKYEPASLRFGLSISLATFAGVLMMLGVRPGQWRRKRTTR